MVKFGFAIAALLGGLIMEAVGFDPDASKQTTEAMTGMRLAYIIVPVTGTLIAMAVMFGYDITEERSREIRRQVAERKAGAEMAPRPLCPRAGIGKSITV